jgi:RHS repeat-associated protein
MPLIWRHRGIVSAPESSRAGRRIAGATELTGRALSWSYDGIYRLTNETISSDPTSENGSVAYSLDPVGNRLSDTSSLSGVNSSSSSYNADDELSTNTYDNNGNTLSAGANSFTYDAENHLLSMNSGAVTLLYDGDGNRVAKTVSGVTTQYLVDDLNPTGLPQVVDELVGGAVDRKYTYGLQRISEDQLISGAWTPSFYGYDGGGSVRQLANSAGAVTDTYEYDAFGNQIYRSGTTPNNYLYRGEQYDPNLSLYYLRARYYNPETGRFMSRDSEDGNPFDPKTLHKYLYAGGDPVNLKDPTGKDLVGDALARAWSTARTIIEGTRIGESALCFLKFISDIVRVAPVGFYNGIPINANIAVFYGELQDCLELASYL